MLSRGDTEGEDGGWGQIHAYRQLKYARMLRELAVMRKNAELKSGSRGFQARKELLAFEKVVEDAKKKYASDLSMKCAGADERQRIESKEPPLDSEKCQDELMQASQLMVKLKADLDEVRYVPLQNLAYIANESECCQRRLVDLEARAQNVLGCLGFTKTRIRTPLEDLSGGWQMRCMLANVLLQDADIMILDEPTNFLDLLGIMWLQTYLLGLRSSSPKTLVVVSHDRAFMDQVCEELILLKDQTLVYFDGNLTAYEEDLASRRLNLERMQESQNRQIAHMKETIADNIKAGKKHGDDNKLRQAVSRRRKIEDRSGMEVNARGGRFKLSRDRAGIIGPTNLV